MGSVGFQPFQLEEMRVRLRKMSDTDLLRFGRAAAGMCLPEANFGHRSRAVFVEQLQEARAEWRRRHPMVAAEAQADDRIVATDSRTSLSYGRGTRD